MGFVDMLEPLGRCTVGSIFTRISLAVAFYVQRQLGNIDRKRQTDRQTDRQR